MQQMLIPDGGVLVNLYLSQMVMPILGAYPLPCAATNAVLAEQVPSLEQPDISSTLAEALHAAGTTITGIEFDLDIEPTCEETYAERFLDWASLVPDVTAHMLMHVERGRHHVASDDPCIRAAIQELAPNLTLLSTADLVWQWHIAAHPSMEQLRTALTCIEVGACFVPTDETTAGRWWRQMM